mgnify:CR=1 FL=1
MQAFDSYEVLRCIGRKDKCGLRARLAAALEELDGALVLFGGGARVEGAEVAAPAGLGIDLAGVEAVLAGGELADHVGVPVSVIA